MELLEACALLRRKFPQGADTPFSEQYIHLTLEERDQIIESLERAAKSRRERKPKVIPNELTR